MGWEPTFPSSLLCSKAGVAGICSPLQVPRDTGERPQKQHARPQARQEGESLSRVPKLTHNTEMRSLGSLSTTRPRAWAGCRMSVSTAIPAALEAFNAARQVEEPHPSEKGICGQPCLASHETHNLLPCPHRSGTVSTASIYACLSLSQLLAPL